MLVNQSLVSFPDRKKKKIDTSELLSPSNTTKLDQVLDLEGAQENI